MATQLGDGSPFTILVKCRLDSSSNVRPDAEHLMPRGKQAFMMRHAGAERQEAVRVGDVFWPSGQPGNSSEYDGQLHR